MHKNKNLRTVLSILLSFFLTLCFIGIMIAVTYRFGFVGKRCVTEAMSESSYVASAQNQVQTTIKELLQDRKLPEDLAEQLFDEDQMYLDITNYVDAVYGGKTATLDTTEFNKTFTQVMDQYLLENNVSVSEQLQESILVLKKNGEEAYRQYMEPTFAKTLYQMNQKYSQKAIIAAIICAVVAVLISIVLLLMYHYKHRAIRYILYSLITASVLQLAVILLVKMSRVEEQLGVGPVYYVQLFKTYIQKGTNLGFVVLVVAVATSLALAVVGKRLKHTSK